ncbi:MAG: hypothetical protein NVS9B12_10420 [Vulcanimicrobiaceae bacterium]
MKRTLALLVAALVAFAVAPARADQTPPPLSPIYDDPAIHFEPAKDWVRVPMAPVDLSERDKLAPIAVYVHNFRKEDEQHLVLEMEPFGGLVDPWESNLENELRAQYEGVLIRKQRTRLANGMPAFWLNLTSGSGFSTIKIFGYAVSDGRRGIFMAVQGRLGLIDENDAKAALASLAVVLYPRRSR